MSQGTEPEESTDQQLDYGCGSLVLTAVIMIGLITFNSFLVNQFVDSVLSNNALFVQLPRLQRAIQIVAPVLLLIFEYWVYDFFRDRLWHHQDHRSPTEAN